MIRIQPTINSQYSLSNHFNDVFGKYLTPINETYNPEAQNESRRQLLSNLDDEIHESGLIQLEHDADGTTINTDNLIEWLGMYYTIERKD